MSDSTSDEDGVMGYQATTGDAGPAGPQAADGGGLVALDEDLAGREIHRLEREGILLCEIGLGKVPAGLGSRLVERPGLSLLPHLPAERLVHERQVDPQELG